MALRDLTGQKFGRLTVLYRDETKPKGHGKPVYWVCQCECGNIKSIYAHSLTTGKTQSCGCLHKEQFSKMRFDDISGQQFGFLVPLYPVGQNKSGNTIWHCKCLNCGGTKDVLNSYLKTGRTYSCGCISSSYGELKIKQLLQEHNIFFIEQYGFDDCKSNKNYKLRFDFAIFKEQNLYCLIEFQGIQHFKPSDKFDDHETLKERQERDNIKRDYCKKNNITLIEIPYTDKDKLNWEYLKEKCNL